MRRRNFALSIGLGLLGFWSWGFADQSSIGDFFVHLFQKLAGASLDKNLIYSPQAIRQSLGLASIGARGNTQKQLLKYSDSKPQKKEIPYKFVVANRLWVQYGFSFSQSYLDVIDKVGTRPWFVDFTGAPDFLKERINGWVEEKTFGRMKDFIPEDFIDHSVDFGLNLTGKECLSENSNLAVQNVSCSMKMLLSSVAIFKMGWALPFDRLSTREQGFTSVLGKSVQTNFLHKISKFSYFKTNEVSVLELPYANSDWVMDILLPDVRIGLAKFEQSSALSHLDSLFSQLVLQDLHIAIPKFESSSTLELSPILKSLGMIDPFDPVQANFTGMTSKGGLFINREVHKAVLSVTEEGTDSSALALESQPTSLSRNLSAESPSFVADHPFLFFIRDKSLNLILFAGHFVGP